MRKPIFIAVLLLFGASLACNLNINLPSTDLKTGPTVTDPIKVDQIDADEVDLVLSLGAGELTINPGSGDAIVEGTATYNVSDFKPEIDIDGSRVNIQQGDLDINGIPTFKEDIKNKWDLELGTSPISLRVKAGAYVGRYDLGGLRLMNLYIKDGASDVEMTFSEPNRTDMGILDYETGASSVTLRNLANANFSSLIFESGAGNYTLDFSGDLQQNANVRIKSGLSTFKIIVPEGVSTKVTFEGGLTNVTTSGDWDKSGDTYTQSGEGPTLTFTVDMGAGNLEIRNNP